jgi:hypothetical protein
MQVLTSGAALNATAPDPKSLAPTNPGGDPPAGPAAKAGALTKALSAAAQAAGQTLAGAQAAAPPGTGLKGIAAMAVPSALLAAVQAAGESLTAADAPNPTPEASASSPAGDPTTGASATSAAGKPVPDASATSATGKPNVEPTASSAAPASPESADPTPDARASSAAGVKAPGAPTGSETLASVTGLPSGEDAGVEDAKAIETLAGEGTPAGVAKSATAGCDRIGTDPPNPVVLDGNRDRALRGTTEPAQAGEAPEDAGQAMAVSVDAGGSKGAEDTGDTDRDAVQSFLGGLLVPTAGIVVAGSLALHQVKLLSQPSQR